MSESIPMENRAAPRRPIDGMSLTWSAPGAPTRRRRKPRPARGLDVSEVGLGLRSRTDPDFAPSTEVSVWCGVHELTAVVRRCEPITEDESRYGLEMVAVADATVSKLLFYADHAPRTQLEEAWSRRRRDGGRRSGGR